MKRYIYYFNRFKMIRIIVLCILATMNLSLYADGNLIETIQKAADNLSNKEECTVALNILNSIEQECRESNDNSIFISYNFVRGCAYFTLEEYIESIPCWREVLLSYFIGKQSFIASYNLGWIYYNILKNSTDAIKYLQKGVLRFREVTRLNLFEMDELGLYFIAKISTLLGKIYAELGLTTLSKSCYDLLSSLNIECIDEFKCDLLKHISVD